MAPNWQEVAVALGIKSCIINIIATDYPAKCVLACTEMMRKWIDNGKNVSWAHLINAVVRANSDFNALAEDIKYYVMNEQ